MKKILLSIFTIAAMALSTFGQAPEGFKYQAVVRDVGNAILVNRAVGIQLTIQQGSAGGTAVYTETFAPTTNAYGLVNLEIGTGTTLDDFTIIDWANGSYFIETAIDATGGSNYSIMGTSQLMSVPYALYAKTSGNGVGPAGLNGLSAYDLAFSIDSTIGTAQQWLASLTGPDGLDGAPGSDGQDGPIGPQGSNGLSAYNLACPQGPAGANGQDGAVGATGPQGPAGNDGAVGAIGPQGPAGANGQDGAAGSQGVAGTNGSDGAVGAVGPAGAGFTNGASAGDMKYWDGTSWVTLAATGREAATLQMISGVPTWTGGSFPQQSFSFTGSVQTVTVPAGATSMVVDGYGAAGGIGYSTIGTALGGNGGRVEATFSVTAGETLEIYVGGKGSNGSQVPGSSIIGSNGAGGFNGGGSQNSSSHIKGCGGGGASDIRRSGSRIYVSGGGGGGGTQRRGSAVGGNGGDGGGLIGATGATGTGGTPGIGGNGGNTSTSTSGTGGCSNGGTFSCGTSGSQYLGGNGGNQYRAGGGGGGGYYGGGGGGSVDQGNQAGSGGGGGGSSWTTGATNVTHTQGYSSADGNGAIAITFQ
jgi:hypothetical protein